MKKRRDDMQINWKNLLIAISIAFLLLGFMFVGFWANERLKQRILPDVTESYTDTIAPSISDILMFRNELKEQKRIDSVYLSIPDIILVDILKTHGTEIDPNYIVMLYENNSKQYENVLSGSESEKILQSIKEPLILEPESLIKDSLP